MMKQIISTLIDNRGAGDFSDTTFKRWNLKGISTGSIQFDSLLGGQLPIACVTDIFGAAGTGKTQFALQNSIETCKQMIDTGRKGPYVLFIDCSASFRPERIVEIAENRCLNANIILDNIYSLSARTVAEQQNASQQLELASTFANCRLLIVDDVTSNFVSEFEESELTTRQIALSLYARGLSFIANRRGISILLTNSVRSRGDLGEGEATGEILTAYSLYRLHFTREGRTRFATMLQPDLSNTRISFVVGRMGIA